MSKRDKSVRRLVGMPDHVWTWLEASARSKGVGASTLVRMIVMEVMGRETPRDAVGDRHDDRRGVVRGTTGVEGTPDRPGGAATHGTARGRGVGADADEEVAR